MTRLIDTTRESEVINCCTSVVEPSQEARPHISGQFELNRSTGLLLNDNRVSYDLSA